MDQDGELPGKSTKKRRVTDLAPRPHEPATVIRSTSRGDSGIHLPPDAFSAMLGRTTMQFTGPHTATEGMTGVDASTIRIDTPSASTTPAIDFTAMPGLDYWSDLSQFMHLPITSPLDKSRYYLDKLADLNATLLRYVTDIGESVHSSATAASQSNPPMRTESAFQRKTNSSAQDVPHETASVGRMLEFLREFLSILKYYLTTVPITSAPPLTSSSNDQDSDDDFEPVWEVDTPASTTDTPSSAPYGMHSGKSLIPQVPDSNGGRTAISYPTVLALSTCFVSLVRLYRNWLQNMLAILETAARRLQRAVCADQVTDANDDKQNPPVSFIDLLADIPELLPGLHLDGFQLTNYRSLQISIFLQVSMDLIWRIERGVAALVNTSCDGSRNSGSNLAVLKAMLQQESRTPNATPSERQQRKLNEREDIGFKSLKALVRKIRRSLRENVCLQLEEGMPCADPDSFVF